MTKKKIFLIIGCVLLVIGLLIGTGFGIAYLVISRTNLTVEFDENEKHQTFNGFGTSSAWNFRVLGEDFSEDVQDEVISYLYGKEGLDLEIFRYNLGDGGIELEDCTYHQDRKTESFFDSSKFVDYSSFANVENYDFLKDAKYVAMMMKAFEKGNIHKLVIFANSPHYLLTKNKKTHATHALENNLGEEAYEAFSDYYLICSKYINDLLVTRGFADVKIFLSPVNEPQWDWGGEGAIQHGCHFDSKGLAKFYDMFYKKMKAFNAENGTNFVLDIFENGSCDLTSCKAKVKDYFKEFEKYDFFDEIEGLSVHSYGSEDSNGIRQKFQSYLKSKGIDKKTTMSEYCVMKHGVDPSVDMGIYSSKVLLKDLIYNNESEWSWWLGLAFGGYEDGLVYLDKETKKISLTYRYYMYKNIMDYIDVGDVRVKAEHNDTFGWSEIDTVAFKKPDGRLVIIILNSSDKEKSITFSGLSGYTKIQATATSEQGKLVKSEQEFFNTFVSPAKSITTYVFSK